MRVNNNNNNKKSLAKRTSTFFYLRNDIHEIFWTSLRLVETPSYDRTIVRSQITHQNRLTRASDMFPYKVTKSGTQTH